MTSPPSLEAVITDLRLGDFVCGPQSRIGFVVPSDTPIEHPEPDLGNGMRVVNVLVRTLPVPLYIEDVIVKKRVVVAIAQAVGNYILLNRDLPMDYYRGGAQLLDEDGTYIYANGQLRDPNEPLLRYIFDTVLEEKHPPGSKHASEIMRVAHVAIFSRLLVK